MSVPNQDPQWRQAWQQVLSRDPSPPVSFVYAVITTGIYCRPSCPSRRPNPENVRFFASGQEARQNGFRACRRCNPDSSR